MSTREDTAVDVSNDKENVSNGEEDDSCEICYARRALSKGEDKSKDVPEGCGKKQSTI